MVSWLLYNQSITEGRHTHNKQQTHSATDSQGAAFAASLWRGSVNEKFSKDKLLWKTASTSNLPLNCAAARHSVGQIQSALSDKWHNHIFVSVESMLCWDRLLQMCNKAHCNASSTYTSYVSALPRQSKQASLDCWLACTDSSAGWEQARASTRQEYILPLTLG